VEVGVGVSVGVAVGAGVGVSVGVAVGVGVGVSIGAVVGVGAGVSVGVAVGAGVGVLQAASKPRSKAMIMQTAKRGLEDILYFGLADCISPSFAETVVPAHRLSS